MEAVKYIRFDATYRKQDLDAIKQIAADENRTVAGVVRDLIAIGLREYRGGR